MVWILTLVLSASIAPPPLPPVPTVSGALLSDKRGLVSTEHFI